MFKMTRIATFCLISLSVTTVVRAAGPDVIVADLPSTTDYDRDGTYAAIAVGTTSCNIGDTILNWFALPSNEHPVIAQNLYILRPNGRLEQIGASWVKHGFAAVNNGICGTCDGNLGQVLGVFCSDPYGTGLNSGPGLGARIEINPTTGFFDGNAANDHSGHGHSSTAHGCRVEHSQLGIGGANYYIEGHYITADDALSGNGNNNASYRQLSITGNSSNWTFNNVGSTVQEEPAIKAWPGATQIEIDNGLDDGLINVAYRTVDLGGGQWRYEYNIHNLNSNRAIRSFAVPTGSANITNIGFNGTFNHNEGYSEDPSNSPWSSSVSGGNITWSTDTFATDPMANAIRWGTMYTFWFEADVAPTGSVGSLGRFAPGPGSDTLLAQVAAPQAGDCNNNTIADDIEIAGDPSLDCNGNGFLDECELEGNDCNNNQLPDDCDLAGNDCNFNSIPDDCELGANDCNNNNVPDECDGLPDCNNNGTPDPCELIADCNNNSIPDECEEDCDDDGTIDDCENEPDCNNNGIPDDCDITGVVGGVNNYPSGALGLGFGPTSVSHTITVTDPGNVIDVDVSVNIPHTWVNDIAITLEHDGTTITILSGICDSQDDLFVTLDDSGGAVICGNPTTGVINPALAGGTALSTFNSMDALGDWTITINDTFAGADDGTLDDWTITIETENNPPVSDDNNMNGVPDECENCATCSGDVNEDGTLDGRDVKGFVDAYLGAYSGCADIDLSGAPLTSTDITLFVDKLVSESGACP